MRVEHPDPPHRITRAFSPALAPGWYRIEVAFPPEGVIDLLATFRFADGSQLVRRLSVVARNHAATLIRLPAALADVTVEARGSGRADAPRQVTFEPAGRLERLLVLAGRVWNVIRQDPASLVHRAARFALRMGRRDLLSMPAARRLIGREEAYPVWRALFDEEPGRDRALHEERLRRLPPERRVPITVLATGAAREARALLGDLEAQIYPDWELVVVPEGSDAAIPSPGERVQVLEGAGLDVGRRLNAGLSAARGRFILAAPPGLRLRPHALLDLALTLEAQPDACLVYADEDGITSEGERHSPRFKPAWSPEVAAVHDYIGEPALLRAETLRGLGGWREGLGEAARHDTKLRLAERVGRRGIVHLAKLLAHSEFPTGAPEGDEAGRRVITEHLARTGVDAEAVTDLRSPFPRLRYALPADPPLVSIIIPTRDRADLLGRCVGTLRDLTAYPRYEVLIVDNGSAESATHDLFRSWAEDPRIRVLPSPGPFNYSALNNRAAAEARGFLLVLLNNDVEIIDAGWLDEMAGLAARPEIGCVGAKLYYPDRTLQHGGVVVGPGGGAGHGHKHAAARERGYLDRLVTVTDVSAVTAACLAVRKQVYDEVGGLDETALRVAFNDVDLCLKVATAGYRNVWTPFAELIHHESVSRGKEITPERARRFAQEIQTLQTRWGVRLLRDPYYSPHLTQDGEDYSLRTG